MSKACWQTITLPSPSRMLRLAKSPDSCSTKQTGMARMSSKWVVTSRAVSFVTAAVTKILRSRTLISANGVAQTVAFIMTGTSTQPSTSRQKAYESISTLHLRCYMVRSGRPEPGCQYPYARGHCVRPY